MPSAILNDFVAELKAARAVLVPQLEGLEDFNRLNIIEETRPVITVAIDDYKRRIALIDTAIAACDGLTNDAYPDMPVREVVENVFEDLKNNVDTINAAFTKFRAKAEAAAATIAAGNPSPKR